MDNIRIQRDGDADLVFNGEIVAEVESSPNNAQRNYSGSTGRWMVLKLYRTAGGKYVCSREGHTSWQGERTRYEAAVCTDVAGVIAFFEYGRFAKELYDLAGIETAQRVD